MKEDKILSMFFEPERWKYAIAKGIDKKDMRKDQMYQLTKPEVRVEIYRRIRDGKYKIAPPHTAKIPKDNGDFRTVYVNEPVDRVVLSIANDLLFELMPEMTHPRCTSYQKGLGCGRVVQEVSRKICATEGEIQGWKSDLSKYFDSVPIEYVDWAFDEVEKKVVAGGYINHYTLFRRWVMSQMFHMLRKQETCGTNFAQQIQDHGYEYSWRVVERELNAQVKMYKHGDMENYAARSTWFNNESVGEMARDYIEKLRKYVDANLTYRTNRHGTKVWKHTCKGNPYVRLGNKNIFVSDLEKKVYLPLKNLQSKIRYAGDVMDLYNAVCQFNRLRRKMKRDTKMDTFFINAYKGSGAYFTCKNLILFHGATFRDGGKFLGQKKSLKYLEEKAQAYRTDGWRMMGVLKQLISDSGISISSKIDEWKK